MRTTGDPARGLEDVLHRRIAESGGPADHVEVTEAVRRRAPLLPGTAVDGHVEAVLARVDGLGPLEDLLADPAVTEVMVTGGAVWIERDGGFERVGVAVAPAAMQAIVERIVAPLGRRVDAANPVVDGRLPDGSRVHVVLPPIAVDGPCLTIRRFRAEPFAIADFADKQVAGLLEAAVRERRNILVTGGAATGKTSLLNALAGGIAPDERIVTIEDTAELRLPAPHIVRLETRPSSPDGPPEVTATDLVRAALRMRPDRIVVGEVRGGEAADLLQALNTGHDGSLSTCHANGPQDALRRIASLAVSAPRAAPLSALERQVTSAVDLVVHVARAGRRRTVVGVAEVETEPASEPCVRPVAGAEGIIAPLRRPARARP